MNSLFFSPVRFKGNFVRTCPGTPQYICCGYYVVNLGNHCSLDCAYCILQAYFEQERPVLHVNIDDLLAELGKLLSENPRRKFRIGTGEFGDSMELENELGLARRLIPLTGRYPNLAWEFKTKTAFIKPFLQLSPNNRVILSWSLNSFEMAGLYERKAPAVEQRIEAAAQAVEAGYRVGFHFDPLIRYPAWREGYQETLGLLSEKIPSDRIAWISLGCFRFMPRLKEIIRKHHPDRELLNAEFIPAGDGKMRYFKPLRLEMYSLMLEEIRKTLPSVCVYLCMENADVWRRVFGFIPGESGCPSLGEMLDSCCWINSKSLPRKKKQAS
ncbi:MAG: radical SAM protein [bacterium]